ncbi:MAG: DNA polymerase IV [Bdellovibrionota bacterium]|nr:DNA polymerase IV [Bdellovibrionota bacterium]
MSEKGSETRKIIHIDMDCFYAAVEELDFPELKGKPVAIGGGRRGVLSTANYKAREFGVRSAMPTQTAQRLCPQLILRNSRFDRYRELSYEIRQIFLRHTDLIEPLSLDEAYLDVTKNRDFGGSATWLAKAIKKEIFEKTGLIASAGVAPNKFLAKVASDWEKPNGLFTIAPDQVADFVKDLDVAKINGVGKVGLEHLRRWNIQNCGDLQKWSKEDLCKEFGNWGTSLYDYARGIDHRKVSSKSDRKSLSVENTFFEDLDLEDLRIKLPKIYKELELRLSKIPIEKKKPIKTIYLKLKTFDFEITTVDQSHSCLAGVDEFQKLLNKAYERKEKAARLLGLGVRFEDNDSLRSLQVELEI